MKFTAISAMDATSYISAKGIFISFANDICLILKNVRHFLSSEDIFSEVKMDPYIYFLKSVLSIIFSSYM